jgi:hypothetical protein
VDAAACRVLTSNSTLDQPDVRTCRITDIAKKLRGRNFTAMDAGNNVVAPGDLVRAGGPRRGGWGFWGGIAGWWPLLAPLGAALPLPLPLLLLPLQPPPRCRAGARAGRVARSPPLAAPLPPQVTINEGRFKGRQATSEYVFKGHLFLKSQDFAEVGGFLCLRAKGCLARGGKPPVAPPAAAAGRLGLAGANMPKSPAHFAASNFRSPAQEQQQVRRRAQGPAPAWRCRHPTRAHGLCRRPQQLASRCRIATPSA